MMNNRQGRYSEMVEELVREKLVATRLQNPFMVLSNDEKIWALQLKLAAQQEQSSSNDEDDNEMFNLSDFEYAQHAIIAQGNIQEAMDRIEGMHHFRKEYGIDHSGDQIAYYLQEIMKQQPGYLLHLDNNPNTNDGVIAIDAARWDPVKALTHDTNNANKDPEFNWKVSLIGVYYMHYVVQPSLASIRQGLLTLVECDGVSWRNFSIQWDNRFHGEMFGNLPVKFKACLAYNTSMIANLVFSMMKPIMPKSMKDSLHLGCSLLGSDEAPTNLRLGDVYLQPSREVVQRAIVQRAMGLTAQRRFHEMTFKLE
ncbi:expressed unknown protein [Seminavis robusta]|uniref:Uncharacterized protein n=1 Tax=Seminavis robusta TaxID=568900 RepID=A0A9N8HXW7_9STRA|nr:expressed unknown protein [Seminavis robusta]|eukprot:Sro2608_g332460.1 n/a (311) ;mRNA; f:4424-5356